MMRQRESRGWKRRRPAGRSRIARWKWDRGGGFTGLHLQSAMLNQSARIQGLRSSCWNLWLWERFLAFQKYMGNCLATIIAVLLLTDYPFFQTDKSFLVLSVHSIFRFGTVYFTLTSRCKLTTLEEYLLFPNYTLRMVVVVCVGF